jgi:secreted Zn-dependent insulinase-like peptidase
LNVLYSIKDQGTALLLSRLVEREYVANTLQNKLEFALIKCPKAAKASFSISIGMGHFNDPDNCPGLSHLLEHMLFTGSHAYTDGNYLHDLLHKNGGFINAWTSAETCNFHFDCPHTIFHEALDVLLDMLKHPNMSLNGIQQEVLAVDAEFQLRQQDDVRRLYDIHKETANIEHPFTKFSVGNKGIFSRYSENELQTMLKQHHEQYFISSNIKVAIVAEQSWLNSENMQAITDKLSIFDDKLEAHSVPQLPDLYLDEHKQIQIEVKPHKFTQNLMLTYCLPNLSTLNRSKPILLLSHLIEDSNENGLQWRLKRLGYIVEVSASGGINDKRHQDININLRLTDKGADNVQNILTLVCSWFEFLQQQGIEHWRFDEKAQQLALQVKHAPSPSGIDEAVLLATRLHEYTLAQALSVDTVMDRYDSDTFDAFLAHFKPANLRVFFIHENAQTDKISAQYDAPYSVRNLATFAESNAQYDWSLPQRNPYMSDDFNIVKAELTANQIINFESDDLLIKFTQNTVFNTPKGDCYFSLESPNMIGSARNIAIKRLWVECISEQLNNQYNSAELAGIHFRLYGHQGGISLHTSGFSHRQLVLCEEILRALTRVKVTPSTFLTMKEKLQKSLQNTLLNKPVNQLFSELNCLYQENTIGQKSILEELNSVFLPELQAHVEKYFIETHVEGLVVGNWTLEQAGKLFKRLKNNAIHFNKAHKSGRRVADLHEQNICLLKENHHSEHAVVHYIQAKDSSLKSKCLFVAMEKLLSPIIFDELRNKQNLGYLVGCGYMPINTRPGIASYVQSPNYQSNVLFEAIENVLHDFCNEIDDIEPIFDNFINSLSKQFSSDDNSTTQYAQRLWLEFETIEAQSENANFYKQIKALSFDEFKAGIHALLSSTKMKRSVFLTTATNDVPARLSHCTIAKSVIELKKSCKYV